MSGLARVLSITTEEHAEIDANIFTPTPWGVVHSCWWRSVPIVEPVPIFDLPKGWVMGHKNAACVPPILAIAFFTRGGRLNLTGNSSSHHRLRICTRDAFGNLRVAGYIANIAKSKTTLFMYFHSVELLRVDTRSPSQLTVVAQRRYKRHRKHPLFSSLWVRLYAFPGHFCPGFPAHCAKFSVKAGDCIDGDISPSFGQYETCVLERRSEINRPFATSLLRGADRSRPLDLL